MRAQGPPRRARQLDVPNGVLDARALDKSGVAVSDDFWNAHLDHQLSVGDCAMVDAVGERGQKLEDLSVHE